MTTHGLSKEEKNKFTNFFRTWFKSQNKYSILEISKEVNIPAPSLYDYIYYNKSPNSIEKANLIISFIKKNSTAELASSFVLKPAKQNSPRFENIQDDAVVLCQISELTEAIKKLENSLESFKKQSSPQTNKSETGQLSERILHIKNLEHLLLSLHSELIWFKNATSDDRKKLRKSLKSKDVGYITSLLRSMMKGEEEINDWMAATTYQLEMVKWKKRP